MSGAGPGAKRCFFSDSPGWLMGAQSIQLPPGDLPTQPPSSEADGAEGKLHALPQTGHHPPILTPKGTGHCKGRRGAAEGAASMSAAGDTSGVKRCCFPMRARQRPLPKVEGSWRWEKRHPFPTPCSGRSPACSSRKTGCLAAKRKGAAPHPGSPTRPREQSRRGGS